MVLLFDPDNFSVLVTVLRHVETCRAAAFYRPTARATRRNITFLAPQTLQCFFSRASATMPPARSYSWLSMENLLEEKPSRFSKNGFEWHCIKALQEVKDERTWELEYNEVHFENNQAFRAVLNSEFYSDFNCRIEAGSGGLARTLYETFAYFEEGTFVAGIIENWDDILILPRQLNWGDRRAEIARIKANNGWYYEQRDHARQYGPVLFYIKSWSDDHAEEEWDLLEDGRVEDDVEVGNNDDDDDDDDDDGGESGGVSNISDTSVDDDDDDDDDDEEEVDIDHSENAPKRIKLMPQSRGD